MIMMTVKNLVCGLPLALLLLCLTASAQKVELNGGVTHVSDNQGMDGFTAGAALWFTPRVSIAADYDSVWDTSKIGQFELTSTGLIVSKSHMENYLFGPRIFFPGAIKSKNKHLAHLVPYGEAEFGLSHLKSTLQDNTTNASQSSSDTAFSWMLGGGADYKFSPHWAGRVKLDLLRTHLADTGQSRLRFGAGIVYTFGQRK
jgi:hypothetical protein